MPVTAPPPLLHDLACVVHLHSTHSDGTGTVAQIAAAGRRNALDAILLTDHDTLAARRLGEEGWYGSVLVLAGVEVSPWRRDHTLAFGIDEPIDHDGLGAADICAAVAAAGGVSFAAHPLSRGSPALGGLAKPHPYTDLRAPALTGIELWSFVTDTGERLQGVRDAVRFAAAPQRFVDHPPERNLVEWDRLCRERRLVAIGGLDAHQVGLRVGGRVPLRLMGYARSFRHLRTHVLCAEPPSGELERDRAQVLEALREGRCYLAMDSVAPARGFALWATAGSDALPMGAEAAAGDWTLHARLPRPASELRLLRDGATFASARGAAELDCPAGGPGVFRVEARLRAHGRERTWIVSNPIYLR